MVTDGPGPPGKYVAGPWFHIQHRVPRSQNGVEVAADGSITVTDQAITAPFTIGHITDLHFYAPSGDGDPDVNRAIAEHLRERAYFQDSFGVQWLVDRVHELKPTFLVCTGDNVDVYTAEGVEGLKRVAERFGCPVYWSFGNHDVTGFNLDNGFMNPEDEVADERLRVWREVFDLPGNNYVIEHNGVRFLQLECVKNYFSRETISWLNKQISEHPYAPTCLAFHVPAPIDDFNKEESAFGRSKPGHNLVPGPETDEFVEIVRKNDSVKILFCGHVHFPTLHWLGRSLQVTTMISFFESLTFITLRPVHFRPSGS